MGNVLVILIRRVLRLILKKDAQGPDEAVRNFRKALGRVPGMPRFPGGVSARPLEPGELGDVQGEWVGVPAARRTILHHHGGAYVAGDPAAYRNLGAHLARPLLADVLLARYRLAPEHRYPAALDDAVATYRALVERVDPATLAVSGDSAGGGLTLAMLQRVRDEGLPLPAAGVLLSPWADLTDEAPSRASNGEADDMLTRSALAASARAYLGDVDPHEPGASPLHGNLGGLPPLLVAVDDSEILLDDATRIVEGVTAAGGEAVLLRRSGLFHVWPVLVPTIRAARETVAEIAQFLEKHVRQG